MVRGSNMLFALQLFLAQAASDQQGGANPLLTFAPLIIIFILFYFFMIRGPMKRQEQERQSLLSALKKNDKVGIAKVVIKTRQHLAAIKPQKAGLMLELMRFPAELLDASEFKSPAKLTASNMARGSDRFMAALPGRRSAGRWRRRRGNIRRRDIRPPAAPRKTRRGYWRRRWLDPCA